MTNTPMREGQGLQFTEEELSYGRAIIDIDVSAGRVEDDPRSRHLAMISAICIRRAFISGLKPPEVA